MTTPAYSVVYSDDFLAHHGVKGQKWGVRRYQNEDGSYKSGAQGRYNDAVDNYKNAKKAYRVANKEYNKSFNKAYNRSGIHITAKGRKADDERWGDVYDKGQKRLAAKQAVKDARAAKKEAKPKMDPETKKKIIKGVAIGVGTAAVTAGAVYAAKKLKGAAIKELTEEHRDKAKAWFTEEQNFKIFSQKYRDLASDNFKKGFVEGYRGNLRRSNELGVAAVNARNRANEYVNKIGNDSKREIRSKAGEIVKRKLTGSKKPFSYEELRKMGIKYNLV